MDFQSLVETKLDPIGASSNDIIYRCPLCDDSSGHLYVDYDKEYWHCFKCDAGGKIASLLRILQIDIKYDYSKLYSEVSKELDEIIDNKKSRIQTSIKDYSTDLTVLTEYYNQHTKPLTLTAYDYLINRGLTPSLISRYQMREGVDRYNHSIRIKDKEYAGRDYSGRIMIPSLRRDRLISFYVGRDYIGDKAAKYLNPPNSLGVASEDVWNLDIVNSDSVIICEGVMTAIAASPIKMNAVATYGKSIAHKSSSAPDVTSQGEKLLARKFKNYYVAYDADAHKESVDTCQYLYDRGANVYLVSIDPKKYGPKADVADIGYDEFLKLLSQSQKFDRLSAFFSS